MVVVLDEFPTVVVVELFGTVVVVLDEFATTVVVELFGTVVVVEDTAMVVVELTGNTLVVVDTLVVAPTVVVVVEMIELPTCPARTGQTQPPPVLKSLPKSP